MPKFDVIIPAYNAAKYLAIALESVEAQTFDDWRILLVDDGSTDNTAAVVAPYAERLGPKLKYIHQANRGLPGARNTAIRNSSAEFLALLDADDVWFPCRLEETLKTFEAHPKAGLVYGFTTLIDPEGTVTAVFDRKQKNGEGAVAPYIYMRKIDLPCPTVTFRKECVDEVGLFDETLRATEDRDLWLRIALRYEVAVVPALIGHYRTSPGSMSTDPERMLQAQLQFIEKHYGAPGCGPVQRRLALSQVYKQHAIALGAKRRPWAGLGSSARSFGLYPFDRENMRTAGSLLLQGVGLGA